MKACRNTKLIRLVLYFILMNCSYVFADTLEGDWVSASVFGRGVHTLEAKKGCNYILVTEYRVTLSKSADEKYEGHFIQLQEEYLNRSDTSCARENTLAPGLYMDLKVWRLSGKKNEKTNVIDIVGHSGRCDPKWDGCEKGSMHLKDFNTKFMIINNKLVDTFGTDKIQDDTFYVNQYIQDEHTDEVVSAAKNILKLIKKGNWNKYEQYVSKAVKNEFNEKQLKSVFNTLSSNYKQLEIVWPPISTRLVPINEYLRERGNAVQEKSVVHYHMKDKSGNENNNMLILVKENNSWKVWSIL